jgi:hypothetical protein
MKKLFIVVEVFRHYLTLKMEIVRSIETSEMPTPESSVYSTVRVKGHTVHYVTVY